MRVAWVALTDHLLCVQGDHIDYSVCFIHNGLGCSIDCYTFLVERQFETVLTWALLLVMLSASDRSK